MSILATDPQGMPTEAVTPETPQPGHVRPLSLRETSDAIAALEIKEAKSDARAERAVRALREEVAVVYGAPVEVIEMMETGGLEAQDDDPIYPPLSAQHIIRRSFRREKPEPTAPDL